MEINEENKVKVEDITKEEFARMIAGASENEDEEKKKSLSLLANKIAEKFYTYKDKAIVYLKDAEELDKFLERVAEKFQKVGPIGKKLAYIPELIMLVRSFAIKEYTDISLAEIVVIIAALIYFVSPLDVLPDTIPGLGILDDAIVVTIVIGWCDEDIDKYMEWRKNRQ